MAIAPPNELRVYEAQATQTTPKTVEQSRKPISESARNLLHKFTGWVRGPKANPDMALSVIAAMTLPQTGELDRRDSVSPTMTEHQHTEIGDQAFLPEVAELFRNLGINEPVDKYLTYYAQTGKIKLSDLTGISEGSITRPANLSGLVKESPVVVGELMKLGVPPEQIAEVASFEKSRPKYPHYSLTTHAQRAEHYLTMLKVAEEKGPQTGFQLRSKEENNDARIGINSYSPQGRGKEFAAGETFTSWTQNAISGFYGDLVWVGHHDVLFRDQHLAYKARLGEINVYSKKGELLDDKKILDRPDSPPESINRVIQWYQEMQGQPESDSFGLGNEQIAQVKIGLEKMIAAEPNEGINLFSPFLFCMVPADKLPALAEAIQNSRLEPTAKALLQSQLVPYEGTFSGPFAEIYQNPSRYIEKVSQNTQATTSPMRPEQVRDHLDTREALVRTTITEDKNNFYHLSNMPLPVFGSDLSRVVDTKVFRPETTIALREQLSQTPEWQFLREFPKEADGILHPIFKNLIQTAITSINAENKKDDPLVRSRVEGFLLNVGKNLREPVANLDPRDQKYILQLLGLPEKVSLDNKTALEAWKEQTFPFSK